MSEIMSGRAPPGPAAQDRDPQGRRTQKYRLRQAQIVRSAVAHINGKGVRGMTLADVAAGLGMVPTGVIYYFASKEELAAACFLKTLEAYDGLIAEAERGRDRAERVGRLVRGYVARARDVALGAAEPLAVFNDVRALDDPGVNAAYTAMFRRARDLLGPMGEDDAARQGCNAAAHLILSQLFWSVVWLPRYDPQDYERAGERMLDILERGLGTPGVAWAPRPTPGFAGDAPREDVSRETFLRAATQIINEEGYRGASVEKISARLNVTKGSFYHHIEAKDDLVVACFRRTAEVMRRAQRTAGQGAKDGWSRLGAAAAWLVEQQVAGDTPLLRTSALTSAPPAIRADLLAEFDRISLAFASMISDGVADGSLRAVDPNIAAQLVTAMINAGAELQYWAPRLSPDAAIHSYVRALFQGVGATLPGR
ncbi:MAG TPA: TetR/AcrR family transcriptional regulator [Caulobacteraceae bacterium]|nr:TetR/AcrR family transcriptional regulator [Caulobacteraceae bacterium]